MLIIFVWSDKFSSHQILISNVVCVFMYLIFNFEFDVFMYVLC